MNSARAFRSHVRQKIKGVYTRPSQTMRRKYFCGFIVVLFLVRLYFAFQRARAPFQLDYEEGNVLYAAVRLLHYLTPYPQPGSFPYMVNSHGPTGYLLSALSIKIFGLSLFGPRIVVLIGGVLISFLIARLVQQPRADARIGWLFGLLYLCSPLVWNWYPLLRVDFWAILLSLCGVYVFAAFPRLRPASSIFFAAALLTKPTALAAPFACALELVLQKRIKELAVYSLLLGTLLAGVALWLGPGFRFAMLRTHPDPYSLKRELHLYLFALEGAVLPVVITLSGLFAGFRWNPASRVLWFYFFAACLTSFTAGKLGSETNHFLEWTAAVCILAGLSLSHMFEVRTNLSRPLFFGVALLTGLLSFLPERVFAPSQSQGECVEAYGYVKSFPGDHILSEDVSALVLGGKPVLIENPYGITQLDQRVWWTRGALSEMVRKREFDLIVLGGEIQNFDPGSGRWSTSLIQNIASQYRLERRFLCSPTLGAVYVRQNKQED